MSGEKAGAQKKISQICLHSLCKPLSESCGSEFISVPPVQNCI